VSEIQLREEAVVEAVDQLAGGAVEPSTGLLPGELRPHPSPLRYVLIAIVLMAVTAAEVSLYYLEGTIPDAVIIPLLLIFAALKFGIVASWYMHLRTDRPIFARFFILGITAAIVLYLIVLSTLAIFA
jgi:cytochrome c oxidase subunit 4